MIMNEDTDAALDYLARLAEDRPTLVAVATVRVEVGWLRSETARLRDELGRARVSQHYPALPW